MSKRNVMAALAAAAFLAACTSPVGPQPSGIDTAASWRRLDGGKANEGGEGAGAALLVASADAEVDQQWWGRFRDPTLDALVREALGNNKTLKIARARVDEARAGRLLAQSALAPQINAEASSERGNRGFLTSDKAVTINQVDIAASWELDLFGRNQARAAQAGAILQSAEASRQAVRVALLAEVARTYFDLGNYARQIELTRNNLATQRKTLTLIQAQFQGAMASNFDVQRAAAQVSATESLIPALRTGYDQSVNRLASLLGRTPESMGGMFDGAAAARATVPPLDNGILVSAPATVLAARPDVRAAERGFAASISGRKAAVAELFPNISLTALFGAQNATPFSSTPWGIGAGLVQPILNFGRISSQIDAADARQRQAFLGYQQTVLEALEDMENALSGYLNENTRNASLSAGVAQNRKAVELARMQFSHGYIGLLDVLVAERDLLDAESKQAASDASLRKDLVRIFAAAGGGWRDQ
ncbi:efflux transporter outer membrane subunit [Cupriavidus sp. 30B13]|uniref:efflux transporter outer membrane subunit n=1 Tax=Cupriavidus sp. 30B13 TaxID=3384241 RepID=UPI003B8EEA4D